MSKQSFHQKLDRWLAGKEEQAALIPIIRDIREDHPRMGARVMYDKILPDTMGRDKFEAYCFSIGLKVNYPKNYRKTTDSSKTKRFPNLIEGIEVTGVNQVLVSDITYYEMNRRFYYLTFITDLYNKEIVGYSVSRSLKTIDTTIPALKMVFRRFGKDKLKGTILHSDGGGQYYADEFRKLTKDMKNSMAKEVYENPHAERINGTIKNDYLIPYGPQNEASLKRELSRAVYNYNTGKPHSSNEGLTPEALRNSSKKIIVKVKKINKTIEVENNSASYFPTSTAQHHN
jgi:transposase InsO family protein